MKKCFLSLEKLKTLGKFSKFAKNEVKAVKVAVSATLHDMSAAPHDASATLRNVSAAPCNMLATHDTHGTSRGLEGPSWGYYT